MAHLRMRERSSDDVRALRAVTSTDGMTADFYPFPHKFLGRVDSHADHSRGVSSYRGDETGGTMDGK